MAAAWLQRARAWGERHPRIGNAIEIVTDINSIVIGLWASTALAADGLLMGLHAARRTPSHEGILLSSVCKAAWIGTGAGFLVAALLYARYIQRMLPKLPRAVLLPLCVVCVCFGLLIETLCGHMSALVTAEGDNDYVNAALKLWTWVTWALCATPTVEWMQRQRQP